MFKEKLEGDVGFKNIQVNIKALSINFRFTDKKFAPLNQPPKIKQ